MSWPLPNFDGVQTGSPEGPAHDIDDRIPVVADLVHQKCPLKGKACDLAWCVRATVRRSMGTSDLWEDLLSGGLYLCPSPQIVEV